ncbi:MAG: hypothetical protein NTX72_01095 [Candidatus Uhrbacteria bacterium]|nr:hypothetical protein [Candidatus Uhrbacteria bacterium]
MNKKEIQVVVASIVCFLEAMGCRALSLEEYVSLTFDLATGKEFFHYRAFDRFTELNLKVGRESFAIVNVRDVCDVYMTKWLNNQLTMRLAAAATAA